MTRLYAIKKNGKFVKDFSDGTRFTTQFKYIEKYTSRKAAVIAAQGYGKENGKGYSVVEL